MSVVFTGSAIVEPKTMVLGMWLDVYCTRTATWYPAKVVKMTPDRVRVQFHNWPKKFNEWVFKVREACLRTHFFFFGGGGGIVVLVVYVLEGL